MKAKRTGLFFTKMKGIKMKVSGRIRKLKRKKSFLFTSSFVVIRNCGPIATKNLTEDPDGSTTLYTFRSTAIGACSGANHLS